MKNWKIFAGIGALVVVVFFIWKMTSRKGGGGIFGGTSAAESAAAAAAAAAAPEKKKKKKKKKKKGIKKIGKSLGGIAKMGLKLTPAGAVFGDRNVANKSLPLRKDAVSGLQRP